MDWPKVLTRCLLCNLLTGLGSPAAAMQTDETRACDNAAQTAALKYGVPPEIMLSIVRVESGRGEGKMPWPWTINSDGKSYWFETRKAAIEFADEKLAAGSNNFDIGCFQINLRWHSDAFVSLEDALDPSANADYAAQFLNSLFQSEGDWKSAVAAYHSRSAELAKTYIARSKRPIPITSSRPTKMLNHQHPSLLSHKTTFHSCSRVRLRASALWSRV